MDFYKGRCRISPPQDPVTPEMHPAYSAGNIDENNGGRHPFPVAYNSRLNRGVSKRPPPVLFF